MNVAAAPGLAEARRYRDELWVAGLARREVLHILGPEMAPVLLDVESSLFAFLGGGRPGVVLVGIAPLRERAECDERNRPRRIRGCEEHGHAPALRVAEESCPLRSDRFENGPDVIHALLERRQLVVPEPVGESGTALVEENQARERAEPVEEMRHPGVFPHCLDVRHPAGHEDEIDRAVSHDLIRDVQVATAGVLRLGRHQSAA